MDASGSKLRCRKGKGKLKAPSKVVDRTRRPWSKEEDELLLEMMLALVQLNWKTENGFKPGYQKKLALMMRTVKPDCDLCASPHINSKITQWKRSYGSLRLVIDKSSGVGFNTVTNTIDCNDEQWEKAVQRDPNLSNMRYKPWPYYGRWIEVFGDDRATGSAAQDVYNMFSKIVEEDEEDTELDDEEDLEETDDFGYDPSGGSSQVDTDTNMQSDTPSQGTRASIPPVVPSRPRKRSSSTVTNNSDVDGLVVVLNKLVTSSDERLGTLCEVMRYESDKGKVRQDIFNMIDDIPNLTVKDKVNVSQILAKNSNCMEMFIGFPPHARFEYIAGLLSGEFTDNA